MPEANEPIEQIVPTDFSIVGYYDQQRFKQFNPSDCANWYLVQNDLGKKKVAMYPVMGRRHISFLGTNRLIFANEPRGMFKSINYSYYFIENSIIRVDKLYNEVEISQGKIITLSGKVFFTFLVTPDVTFACFTDGQKIYIYREDTGSFDIVTDANAPTKPLYIATFGNRIVVSQENSSQFTLSEINLDGTAFDPATCFTVTSAALFAQESGIIRQFGVLHNTLYIFTDYTTGIWSNIPSILISSGGTQTSFPWKKNTTYDWDFGMADPNTLSIGFSMMTWMAQNSEGLVQVMMSGGQQPKPISTKAIDILFQKNVRQGIIGDISPFLNGNSDGFLYQWENTIFYRLSAGDFQNYGILDIETKANSIEYNFDTETWERVIEKNGERNRIQKHIFFNNVHFVSVKGDTTIYEMSGQFYNNEISNPDRVDPQSADAYIREPFRYERVTPIIAQDDYGEFITDWVEIDFVWGENLAIFSESPFQNAQFIIDEEVGLDGEPQYLITDQGINGNPVYILSEEGNTPQINETTYNQIFKPHIELYWSDDGGVSFFPADNLEFSQLGVYEWRMRWYQLGASRNRCYKLICVSDSPIVVLGGIMVTRRVSGGAS
jgi:hypothetical protein